MKRRDFMKTSLALAGTAAAARTVGAAPPAVDREFYELRQYHLRRGPMTQRFDTFFREAALPALNRAGAGPIGVFNVVVGPDNPTVYVLIPHRTAGDFATVMARAREDADYRRHGTEFTQTPATNPSYVRVESSLLRAFASVPKLEIPAATAEKKPRLFELRAYESHSLEASRRKMGMFDDGEIALFRRAGLTPVFFGETLVGTRLPSLTYLLVFENMAEREKNWGTFAADPEWKKLSATPGLTDAEIVTNISNVFLRPAAYSQI